jgi:hypothetical protein
MDAFQKAFKEVMSLLDRRIEAPNRCTSACAKHPSPTFRPSNKQQKALVQNQGLLLAGV